MIVSTCTRLSCLSACRKNFIIHFIVEILHLKNPAIWLAVPIWELEYETGGEISTTILVSILDYSQEKLIIKVF